MLLQNPGDDHHHRFGDNMAASRAEAGDSILLRPVRRVVVSSRRSFLLHVTVVTMGILIACGAHQSMPGLLWIGLVPLVTATVVWFVRISAVREET